MATLQELLAQKQALETQIREAQSSQRTAAIAEIRRLMEDAGLTPADISAAPKASPKSSGASSATKGRTVAPKYRHPASGQTWTGRGLKPKWLTEELAAGKSIDDFTI